MSPGAIAPRWLSLLSPAVIRDLICLGLRFSLPSDRQGWLRMFSLSPQPVLSAGLARSLWAGTERFLLLLPSGQYLKRFGGFMAIKIKKGCSWDCAQEASGLFLGSEEGLSSVLVSLWFSSLPAILADPCGCFYWHKLAKKSEF